ncbi:tyrosinase family protein [Archangium violaceum]|uniref:tyrosinase family protein n=1 Tax=Archangium violaceum TaxID=83451 RepID=UPI001952607C|nr:tyrosinase family protein [Archangium violaceum]QRN93329.1 tyrosinase family protein [Archangium violaceum]
MKDNGILPLSFLASPIRRALLLLGSLLVAGALAGCSEPVRQRKNVKDLTPQEKQDYVDAVLKLKSTPSPYDSQLSWYDQFVTFHKQVYHYRRKDKQNEDKEYQVGHLSPSFLPWHRKFLLMYEQALREVSGKDISLPYWDWTDEASTHAVFSEDFMGRGGDTKEGHAVLQGPFRKGVWEVKVFSMDEKTKEELKIPYLVRSTLEMHDAPMLPTTADMDACLKVSAYDEAPWDDKADSSRSFRSCLEGWGHSSPDHMHNAAHIWVGGIYDSGPIPMGSMAALDTSPNDPAFFLHHANVDRLWALWEQRHGNSYVPNGEGNPGWNPEDSLYPFDEHPDDSRVKMSGNTVGDMIDLSRLDYEYR